MTILGMKEQFEVKVPLVKLLGNFLVAEEQVIKQDPVLDVGSLLNGRIRSIVGTIL